MTTKRVMAPVHVPLDGRALRRAVQALTREFQSSDDLVGRLTQLILREGASLISTSEPHKCKPILVVGPNRELLALIAAARTFNSALRFVEKRLLQASGGPRRRPRARRKRKEASS